MRPKSFSKKLFAVVLTLAMLVPLFAGTGFAMPGAARAAGGPIMEPIIEEAGIALAEAGPDEVQMEVPVEEEVVAVEDAAAEEAAPIAPEVKPAAQGDNFDHTDPNQNCTFNCVVISDPPDPGSPGTAMIVGVRINPPGAASIRVPSVVLDDSDSTKRYNVLSVGDSTNPLAINDSAGLLTGLVFDAGISLNPSLLKYANLSGITQIQTLDVTGCMALEEINLGGCTGLTSISADGAAALKYIDLYDCPLAVTLSANAFNGCAALEYAIIPNVSRIEPNAFAGCAALKAMWIDKSVTVATDAFSTGAAPLLLLAGALASPTPSAPNNFPPMSAYPVITTLGGDQGGISIAGGQSIRLILYPMVKISNPGGAFPINTPIAPPTGLAYQWFHSSTPIGSAISTYTKANAAAADAGKYTASLTLGGHSCTTNPFRVDVDITAKAQPVVSGTDVVQGTVGSFSGTKQLTVHVTGFAEDTITVHTYIEVPGGTNISIATGDVQLIDDGTTPVSTHDTFTIDIPDSVLNQLSYGAYDVMLRSYESGKNNAITATKVGGVTAYNVTVAPSNPTVTKGYSTTFYADETPDSSLTFNWSVVGASPGTAIDQNGKLTVASNETANSFKVKAVCVSNPDIFGETTVNVVGIPPLPAVLAIYVSPMAVTLEQGGAQNFNANVIAQNGAPTSAAWQLSGQTSANTKLTVIDSNNVKLYAGEDETAKTLYVMGIATGNTNINAVAKVTVVPTDKVLSVQIAPKSATVPQGKTQQFTATVTTEGAATKDVNWRVNSTVSTIDANGLLTVDLNEPLDQLTVTVTSVFDPTKVDTATVDVEHETVPKVTRLKASWPDSYSNTGTLTLSWNMLSNIEGYNVYIDGKRVADVSTNTYTVTGKAAGTRMSAQVSAYVGDNEGEKSDVLSTSTRPAAPDNAYKVSASKSTYKIKWDKSNGANYYRLYLKQVGEAYEYKHAATVGPNAKNEYTFTGLVAGVEYAFKVVPVARVDEVSIRGVSTTHIGRTIK